MRCPDWIHLGSTHERSDGPPCVPQLRSKRTECTIYCNPWNADVWGACKTLPQTFHCSRMGSEMIRYIKGLTVVVEELYPQTAAHDLVRYHSSEPKSLELMWHSYCLGVCDHLVRSTATGRFGSRTAAPKPIRSADPPAFVLSGARSRLPD